MDEIYGQDRLVKRVIALIKKEKLLDVHDLKDGHEIAGRMGKVDRLGRAQLDMSDQRWHGGGLSSTSLVDNEVVSGSGTAWALAHNPVAGTVRLYAIGQRLTPGIGNDYTISGTIITTAISFSAGQLIADYRKQ